MCMRELQRVDRWIIPNQCKNALTGQGVTSDLKVIIRNALAPARKGKLPGLTTEPSAGPRWETQVHRASSVEKPGRAFSRDPGIFPPLPLFALRLPLLRAAKRRNGKTHRVRSGPPALVQPQPRPRAPSPIAARPAKLPASAPGKETGREGPRRAEEGRGGPRGRAQAGAGAPAQSPRRWAGPLRGPWPSRERPRPRRGEQPSAEGERRGT